VLLSFNININIGDEFAKTVSAIEAE